MDYAKIKNTDAELKKLLLDRDSRKEYRKKFEDTETVYKAWKKISPTIKKAATEHLNSNQEKAEKLYKSVFLEINNRTSIKGALGESKIKSILAEKDHLGNFLTKMTVAEVVLDKAEKYIGKGTMLCNIASSLYGLYVGHTYRHIYKRQVSKAAELRVQMYHGQEQMMHVVSIVKELSKLAPPGIQEYLDYNLSAFEACGKAFDLVNKYAQDIEKLSNEVFDMLEDSIGARSESLKAGITYIKAPRLNGTKYDINREEDILYGNPSTKHHKKRR